MSQERLSYLLQQLVALRASEAELQELEALLHADADGSVMDQIPGLLNNQEALEIMPYNESKWQSVATRILEADKLASVEAAPAVVKRTGWQKWIVAAAAVTIIAAGLYLLVRRSSSSSMVHNREVASRPDIQPGSHKAVLIMANGKEQVLDSTDGTLFTEINGATISNKNGILQYNPEPRGSQQAAAVYNTLRIPAAGQYQLRLPDGSKVWLNAASSITFPTAFEGKERKVEITGEAYFEIAANAKQPFLVQSGNQKLLVLGTSFNINAYPDEKAITTTLLEGRVKVSVLSSVISHPSSLLLSPNQQSLLSAATLQLNKDANVEEAVAWKNGYFQFDDADIQTVMRQLSRWYDIKVMFEGKAPAEHFDGKMQRSLTLLQVLKNLERIGIRYQLKEKILTLYAN